MLQHNTAQAGERAHIAHAAMISLHALCCGLPIAAVTLAAISGVTSGTSLLVMTSRQIHNALHAHEIWILAASASLVSVGAVLELVALRAKHRRWFSPLFGVSLACFAFNVAIIALHRGV